ncbi:hypothetical protein [Streptomyces sp. DH7]|uniref:hypothetical protein n=1 Tax=Streptomyces sp. DH7 TaxID=2857006 RepID=UPI001E5F40D9|nr:hypothetical protein [Streptomyces sp. DH7]
MIAKELPMDPWRPPPLPDGRNALDELLKLIRDEFECSTTAARVIGLHGSIIEG